MKKKYLFKKDSYKVSIEIEKRQEKIVFSGFIRDNKNYTLHGQCQEDIERIITNKKCSRLLYLWEKFHLTAFNAVPSDILEEIFGSAYERSVPQSI